MTPYELQLGDLVKVADMTVKVTALSEYTINGQPATMFHPIPLTEDVMLANRFYFDYEEQAWKIGDYFRLNEYNIDGALAFRFAVPNQNVFLCKYFHQLQQILRLCGYNELANTLKLK